MKGILIGSTISNFSELYDKLNQVRNSDLDIESKQKVEKAFRKLGIFNVAAAVILISLLIATPLITLMFTQSVLIPVGIALVILLIGIIVLVIGDQKILKDCKQALYLVEMDFDGKTEEEISKLEPDIIEEKMIAVHKRKEFLWIAALLVVLLPASYILVAYGNKIIFAAGVVLAFLCFINMDSHRVEQLRLRSGYYKRNYEILCRRCGEKVEIAFTDMEKYDGAPRSKSGIRTVPCPK